MPGPYRIEGYVIVSRDGMIANADGVMPPALYIDADQAHFRRALERADAVIHGRHSQEQVPGAAARPRLIATASVAALAPHERNPAALLWNPDVTSYAEALHALGVAGGTVAVIGGTRIFGLFLPFYDSFDLSRTDAVVLPGGRPVFPQVPAQTPEQVLAANGLERAHDIVLDADRALVLERWMRVTG